ncbi:MAG: hypothetical protein LC808_23725, partial [Actinobacteria bacterium]|nr:hypothetical protein [Actinomycetota bacterium]
IEPDGATQRLRPRGKLLSAHVHLGAEPPHETARTCSSADERAFAPAAAIFYESRAGWALSISEQGLNVVRRGVPTAAW